MGVFEVVGGVGWGCVVGQAREEIGELVNGACSALNS